MDFFRYAYYSSYILIPISIFICTPLPADHLMEPLPGAASRGFGGFGAEGWALLPSGGAGGRSRTEAERGHLHGPFQPRACHDSAP